MGSHDDNMMTTYLRHICLFAQQCSEVKLLCTPKQVVVGVVVVFVIVELLLFYTLSLNVLVFLFSDPSTEHGV